MRKLLFIIVLMVVIILSGCGKEEKQSIKGWALEYTIEVYNEDYEGYEIFAYNIEPLTLYDKEELELLKRNQYYALYEITIIDNSGKSVIYNVWVVYEIATMQFWIDDGFKESQIIDVDCEVVYDYHEEVTP